MSRERLLPPNHTREEGAFVKISERIKGLPGDAPSWAFHPEEAPEELLPYLAWALGVPPELWNLAKTKEEKIQILREVFLWHQHKGTKHILEKMLAVVGLEAKITEWWETNEQPFTFQISLKEIADKDTPIQNYINIINQWKNLRSHIGKFDFLSITESGIRSNAYSKVNLFCEASFEKIIQERFEIKLSKIWDISIEREINIEGIWGIETREAASTFIYSDKGEGELELETVIEYLPHEMCGMVELSTGGSSAVYKEYFKQNGFNTEISFSFGEKTAPVITLEA